MKAASVFLSLMELLKLQLLLSYCFLLLPRPLPSLTTSLGFFIIIALHRGLARLRMRRLARLFLQLLGVAAFFVLTYARYREAPLLGPLFPPSGAAESLSFFSVLAACALLSLRAIWLATRRVDHAFCVAQFDQGLGLFLAAFFVAALVRVRSPFAERLALPFFLFGILALGSAKRAEVDRGGLARPSRPSMLAAVAATFLIAALSFAALAPALLEPARRAAGTLKTASLEALRLFGLFLGWLLGAPPSLATGGPGEASGLSLPAGAEEAGQASGLVASIILWILLASVAALLAVLAFVGLKRLARNHGSQAEAVGETGQLGAALRRLAAAILRLIGFIARRVKGLLGRRGSLSEARRCYARLLFCGRRAGAGLRAGETPREYGLRLARLFPESARQAGFVVEALEREVYGAQRLDATTLARLAAIRRRLRLLPFFSEGLRRAYTSNESQGASSKEPGQFGGLDLRADR